MTSMLDPDARDLLRLAKLAEQALPRDPERVRQRVLVAVGAAAATSTAASHGAAASAALKTTGIASSHAALAASWLPALVKTVAVVSGLALTGGAAYRMAVARTHATTPVTQLTSSAQRLSVAPIGASVATSLPVAAPSIVTPSIATLLPAITPSSPRQDSALAKAHVAQDTQRTSSPSSPAQAAKRDTAPTPALEPAAAASNNSLSADLRTLSAAQQAFNSGAPARTLSLLQGLRGNELLAEQSALAVFALCALGQTEAASQKAALFRSIASSSPLLPRVNASCAKP